MPRTENTSVPLCDDLRSAFMHEFSYQKWAIWKRMFNLTWDITFGKAGKEKNGPAESDLTETWKKIMEAVFIQGFLTKAYIKN